MEINNVLLTGGNGLVGRSLAPMLTPSYSVTHLELTPPDDGLPCIKGDLRDSAAVAAACEGMDAILHVAALHGRAWAEAGDDAGFEVNVTGTKNILEGAARAGVKRVVFTSSIWAAGHGADPPYLPIDEVMPREPCELYGLTKILGEKMCSYATAKHGFSTIVLRPGGIRAPALCKPADACLLWAAVDARDVAQAHVRALEAPEDMLHDVFIITADTPLCRVDPEEFRREPAAALAKAVPGILPLLEQGEIQLAPEFEWYTIQKAKRLLGYAPQFNFRLSA